MSKTPSQVISHTHFVVFLLLFLQFAVYAVHVCAFANFRTDKWLANPARFVSPPKNSFEVAFML